VHSQGIAVWRKTGLQISVEKPLVVDDIRDNFNNEFEIFDERLQVHFKNARL
jgi:hypothetical protein